MFIGHFGLGFGGKKLAPAVSLGSLFLACQLADLVWPDFVLLGIERVEIEPGATALTPLNFVSYPYSHSLVALCVWAAVVAAIYRMVRKGPVPGAIVLAGLVVSHWVLDVLTHRPDMPLLPGGGPRVGLGLWNSVPATLVAEGALFAFGVWVYARSTRARDRAGRLGLWGLVFLLVAIYVSNLLGPPPPSAVVVAWTAQALWLLVALGYWVDRHRQPVMR